MSFLNALIVYYFHHYLCQNWPLNGLNKIILLLFYSYVYDRKSRTCADRERGAGQGFQTPPEKSQIKGFLEILDSIPWKIPKLPSQHSLSGYHRWWPAFSAIRILCPPKSTKSVWVGPPLSKLSGSSHEDQRSVGPDRLQTGYQQAVKTV